MSILRSVLLATVLVTLASAVPLAPDHSNILGKDLKIDYRLPSNVKPTNYIMTLIPNIVPYNFTFTGESVINITVVKATKTIIFHAKNLTINLLELVDFKIPKTSYKLTSQKHDDVRDFEVLEFDEEIPAGEYELSLSFTGKLHYDLYGFYRSYYINERGETVWLATTNFEPAHARRAFPCFDEPALKATFQISISHFGNYTARSNTEAESITPDPANSGKLITKFEVTPVMSTYLVAFIVSDFTSLKPDNGTFHVWSKSSAIHKVQFAREIGQKALKELETYTGIHETMKKIDNFAVPQFGAQAMENWGLITYRESALLFEENVTTTGDKQSIVLTVSHELAHQWFGNLVTPLWWEFAWLSEGFANYFQYYIADKVEPTWRIMEQFVVRNLQTTFVMDAMKDAHAMNVAVGSPEGIIAAFDYVSYSKAGSVIRMFSHALTDDTFKKGLHAYLTKMKYQAANSDHLVDELVKAANGVPNLRKTLNLWFKQPGYPVLNVIVGDKKRILYVSQERFLSKKPDSAMKPREKWSIPINYVTEKGLNFDETKPDKWVDYEDGNTTITGVDMEPGQWVILNKKQTGYYRVNYDKTNWDRIGAYLSSKKYEQIGVINRAQILDDSFNLAHAGYIGYPIFLNISKYLEREVDYVPWCAAFRAFTILSKALVNTPVYKHFKLFMLRLTANLEKSVSYTETEKDDHVMKLKRVDALKWACKMGSETCRTAAHENLVRHLTGAQKISSDLRSVMLCEGLRSANASIWMKTFNLYANSKNVAERVMISIALGCASDATILKSYLAKTIEPKSTIRFHTPYVAVSVSSPAGIDIAFDFVTENYKAIVDTTKSPVRLITCMNTIAAFMTTQAQVDKLKKFMNGSVDAKVRAAVQDKGLVDAESNVAWVKTYGKDIEAFFDGQKLGATS